MTKSKAWKEVGALWQRGDDSMSFVIDLGIGGKVSGMVYKNEHKEKENQPDYRLKIPMAEAEDVGEGADDQTS